MTDTTVKKVQSVRSPTGSKGQRYPVSGKRVAMRLWENEAPTGSKAESENPCETVGFVIAGKALLEIEGQQITPQPGDSWLVPAGAVHRYRIVETFSALEATAPPFQVHGRED